MNAELKDLKTSLGEHALYQLVTSSDDLRCFMERHVFCVWDFMWLLKSLQRDLTCLSVPWMPPADPEAARLINEIVLGEESDEIAPDAPDTPGKLDKHGSHFEWYLLAMEEVDCEMRPVRDLMSALRRDTPLGETLASAAIPTECRRFVQNTAGFLDAPLHVRGAVFFHSREDLIPRMFIRVVEKLERAGLPCQQLVAYLHRHIEVDGETHGPLAERLLHRLYGGDRARQGEAERAALSALRARHDLWDATAAQIQRAAR